MCRPIAPYVDTAIISHLIVIAFIVHLLQNKKHLNNVGPIHYYEPPHAHSPGVASGTVARRLRIDVNDANDNDNDDDNDNA